VLSGAHVHNFREVYGELTASGGARLVTGRGELAAAAAAWLDEPELARAAGAAGREEVLRNRGATAHTASALLGLIGEA
jgi:3-deoxy-D-manno-octulosonic-acid transferase